MTSHGHDGAATGLPALPLAVQLAFSGSRFLQPDDSPLDAEHFDSAVATGLRRELRSLAAVLRLSSQHFIVGLSQMAIGADMLFSETLAGLGWCHRVFLPQPRDEYLRASGSRGADFTAGQRHRAIALLEAPHVIEERVVSTARDRVDRFDDTNLQLIADADVVVCLFREGDIGRPGGTEQMMARAKGRGVPLLALILSVNEDGIPELQSRWHGAHEGGVALPALPGALRADLPAIDFDADRWPEPQAYANALKGLASARAGRRRSDFRRASCIIVGTHVAATVIATTVLAHFMDGVAAKFALAAEIALLAWGYLTHRRLHARHYTQDWAMARLCAEIGRSVRAVGRLKRSFDHLLMLPMPQELIAVLRTLNVLQLRHTRVNPVTDWREELRRYLDARLLHADSRVGQIAYYEQEARRSYRFSRWAGTAFTLVSALAVGATIFKLALKIADMDVGQRGEWFGVAAVVLPVVAVGVMSMAAALDTDARAHFFAQMHDFLGTQARRFKQVASAREAAALAKETELRLLSETVSWYSRRAYTSIA